MAVYNGEPYVREAIDSVLAQTFQDFEVVIVDDGSDDGTPRLLHDLAERDSRVRVHRQPNEGRARSLNTAIALARAPFIARLDADDVAAPRRFELQVEALRADPELALVGGAATMIAADGHPIADVQYPLTDAAIRTAFIHSCPFVHSAVMFRADAVRSVGAYRPVFREAEDLDLWLRLADRYRLANLADIVVRYRLHGGQATMQNLADQANAVVAARLSAAARSQSIPDPLDALAVIDANALLSIGATRMQLDEQFVRSATWLAKAAGRCGEANSADSLFDRALGRARGAARPRAAAPG
jgi:glycosyltransferase involved in cell wall biosynthesis